MSHWYYSTLVGLGAVGPAGELPIVSPSMAWVDVIQRLNALAGIAPVVMLPGNYTANSAQLLVDGAHIVGGPGVTITSTMPFTGVQTNSVFRAQATASGKTGTLNALAVRGAYTLQYNAVAGGAPVVGEVFAVSTGLSEQIFRIDAVAGGGPYTLTLDRPITAAFANGSPVTMLSARPSIIIEGNGMRVTGTGDRVVEITTGYQCHVSGVHYDTLGGAMGDICFAYDIGGQECVFEDCSADGNGAVGTLYGFAIEAGEKCVVRHCTATRLPLIGVVLIDCIDCGIVECAVTGDVGDMGGGAFGVGTAGGAALGCFNCYLEGNQSQGGVFGFVITLSDDCQITDCSFDYAANAGILFNAATSKGTYFENISTRYCALGCTLTTAGNTNTRFVKWDASNCTTYILSTACDIEVLNLTAINLASVMGPAILCSGAGTLCRFIGLNYANTSLSNVIQSSSNARIEVSDASINMAANSIALYGSGGGGLFVASNIRTAGSAVATNGANLTATTLRRGIGIDFSSTAVQVVLGGAGFYSVGQIVSGGAGAAQAVAWPYLNAQDNVTVERIVNAGAPGIMPLIVYTAGVGFTLTFAGGDTSTYQWSID